MPRYKLILWAVLSMPLSCSLAFAASEPWPAEPIRLVIAYSPGGSTDVAGRLLAKRLSETMGQQVVVENRPGAGGTIGAAYVARSKPDGYTLLMAASPEVSIAPVTMKQMPYDPLKDLAPISLVGKMPFLLLVNPDLPVETLADLIAYAKANPDKLNYSSFGNNTSNHLVGEQFKMATGIRATHVPYKGSGPSIADLIGGRVQYTFDSATAPLAQVQAGKLRALAVTTSERLENAPSIPTMAEAGLPGFLAGSWYGLLAPAGTPQPIIDRLNAETRAALNSAELKKSFSTSNIVPAPGSPGEFRDYIESEIVKWRSLAAQVGIEAQ